LTTCHRKIEIATKSSPASHKCDLSAVESARKVGSPNSAYNGKMSQWNVELRKAPTGETLLLNGCGGRIGITMRSITNAENIKEKKASTIAGTIGNIISVSMSMRCRPGRGVLHRERELRRQNMKAESLR
jgi:hypothetical protein